MKKGCFIVPYFGKFPNTFPVFLVSAEQNPEYDWIIFTDNEYSDRIPQNVRIINTTFDWIQKLVQSKFQFEIALNTPYKLCDYKCAYGYIFEEYITEYDHWGYCDLDIILGDINKFITDEMLQQYDKIGHLGHFSLYKNVKSVTMMFMMEDFYTEVFSQDRIYVFDEWNEGSINKILLENNYLLCYLDAWADVYPHNSYLNLVNYVFDKGNNISYQPDKKIHFFEWNQGLLWDHLWTCNKIKSREIMYVHLQKRRMKLSDKAQSMKYRHIYCVPDMLIEADEWKPLRYMLLSLLKKTIDSKRIRFCYKCFIYLTKEKLHSLLRK